MVESHESKPIPLVETLKRRDDCKVIDSVVIKDQCYLILTTPNITQPPPRHHDSLLPFPSHKGDQEKKLIEDLKANGVVPESTRLKETRVSEKKVLFGEARFQSAEMSYRFRFYPTKGVAINAAHYYDAALHGRTETIEELRDEGVNPDEMPLDDYNKLPLH